MSKAERMLSYSLLSLITSKRVAWGANLTFTTPWGDGLEYETDVASEEPEPEDNSEDKDSSVSSTTAGRRRKKEKGTVNEDGAWCWREGCEGALGWQDAEMHG